MGVLETATQNMNGFSGKPMWAWLLILVYYAPPQTHGILLTEMLSADRTVHDRYWYRRVLPHRFRCKGL